MDCGNNCINNPIAIALCIVNPEYTNNGMSNIPEPIPTVPIVIPVISPIRTNCNISITNKQIFCMSDRYLKCLTPSCSEQGG